MRETTDSDTTNGLSQDPDWPRTGGWPAAAEKHSDIGIIGVPTSLTSLSESHAHLTPAAVRHALRRYSSHFVEPGDPGSRGSEAEWVLDELLRIVDFGDCEHPDTEAGEKQASAQIASMLKRAHFLVTLGGDNAATVPAVTGLATAAGGFENVGLITFDAHHDLRNGRSNGSPVARLVAAGLDPRKIVQVGIADFANSRAYRARARDWGITIIHRDEVAERPMHDIVREACDIAGAGQAQIHVDFDVDVCDRSVAPGCPASLPGGLSAYELRRAIRYCSADRRVRSIDFTEVDASADAPDARTVRLVALGVLEAAAGYAMRGPA